jgi:LuxR family transcriptional regulator, maltose regulon positive regulatory protein
VTLLGYATHAWDVPQEGSGVKRSARVPAKISVPRPSDIVSRPRLHRALDRARKGRAIWVVGAAGAGKTTLVASYLAHRRVPCLWYQVDAGDADVPALFYYLGRAAAARGGRRQAGLPLLTPEYAGGVAVFTRRYFEALFEALPAASAMVFDNDQEVGEAAIWHEVLAGALDSVPEGSSMIFISRREPPAVFAAAIAQGTMAIVGGGELEFTAREAAALIRARQPRRRRTRREIARLVRESRGWAAGLVLLAGGTFSEERTRTERDGAASQRIFDFFATEVFSRLPGQRQEFLLATALLPTPTARMAAALTGAEDAGRILARFHREGFFIQRQSGGADAFRYHPLFRAFLLERAAITLSAVELTSLRRKAAALLLEEEQFEDAVGLLLDNQDNAALAKVVVAQASGLIRQGRSATIESWIERLPPAVVDSNHWLLYWKAIAGLGRGGVESESFLERALAGFRDSGDRAGTLLTLAGLIHAIAFKAENYRKLDRWIVDIDRAHAENGDYPSEMVEIEVATAMVSGLSYRRPEGVNAATWVRRALDLATACQNPGAKLNVYCLAIFLHAARGEIDEATPVLELLRSAMETHAGSPPLMSCAKVGETLLMLVAGELERCSEAISAGLEIGRQHGVTVFESMLLAYQVHRALLLGDGLRAQVSLERLAALSRAGNSYHRGIYHHYAAWHELTRDDFSAAQRHLEVSTKEEDRLGWPFATSINFTGRAATLFGLGGREEEGVAALDRAQTVSERDGNDLSLYNCLLVKADYLDRSGQREKALATLRDAFNLGARRSILGVSFVTRPMLARLCGHALAEGIEVQHARKMIRKFNLPPDSLSTETWPWSIRIYTLGRFEVLRDEEQHRQLGPLIGTRLRLLEWLIIRGGEVPQDELCDHLWPDADGDAARRVFDTTLHRLRRLVGDPQALRLADGRLALDRQRCWTDVWEVEGIVKHLLGALEQPASETSREQLVALGDRLCRLYRGPFFAVDRGGQGEVRARRIHRETLRALEKVATHWTRAGDAGRARSIEQHLAGLAGAPSGPARPELTPLPPGGPSRSPDGIP